jgi:hypothetical protein
MGTREACALFLRDAESVRADKRDMKHSPKLGVDGINAADRQDSEEGLFEITIQARGTVRANRLLSYIVRSSAYDDVECLAVAFKGDREESANDQNECA